MLIWLHSAVPSASGAEPNLSSGSQKGKWRGRAKMSSQGELEPMSVSHCLPLQRWGVLQKLVPFAMELNTLQPRSWAEGGNLLRSGRAAGCKMLGKETSRFPTICLSHNSVWTCKRWLPPHFCLAILLGISLVANPSPDHTEKGILRNLVLAWLSYITPNTSKPRISDSSDCFIPHPLPVFSSRLKQGSKLDDGWWQYSWSLSGPGWEPSSSCLNVGSLIFLILSFGPWSPFWRK